MLKKVLIANRGEIACRIIRTAHRMGVATVAVYADADAGAPHARQAGEAVHIGPSPAPESYLVIEKILAAAKQTGADSVHPGYGFLAENADFADACVAAGLKFIGPSGAAMRALGGKAAAKIIARKAGVPVVPGFEGEAQDAKTLQKEAAKIGYPVMIKAVAGGGGRGMRLVEKEADLPGLLESAQREAKNSFGDARVLIEKVVVKPRHIEVQVFGDSHGGAVHLFERDCTLQRRNQKVVEEAPAPGMSEGLRAKMCAAAVKLARDVGYEGAGTVEFLVEGGALGPDAPWYFIEMNTRLQVEHPVTEEITGLDLVEWQLRVAAGEKLPLAQDAIKMRGHAIEVRLCAEDAAKGFLPSTGKIVAFEVPAGAGQRLETGVERGGAVSPFYDSMIAKLIGVGADRNAAISRTLAMLDKAFVAGPTTNAGFLYALLDHKDVRAAKLDTGLIARELKGLMTPVGREGAIAAGAQALLRTHGRGKARVQTGNTSSPRDPWDRADGFQLGAARALHLDVVAQGKPVKILAGWDGGTLRVQVPPMAAASAPASRGARVHVDSGTAYVVLDRQQTKVAWPVYDIDAVAEEDSGGAVRAPINGKVAKLLVEKGAKVAKGDRIAIVEAMKMEHVLVAPVSGAVSELNVAEGAQVKDGQVLARIA
jgi:3-methylcrotonyl-CoA carboxylase alpha subunit